LKAGRIRLPLIWGHEAGGSPGNWVGEIIDAEETPDGLLIVAKFDLSDPDGRKAYKLAKSGAVSALSIGFMAWPANSRRAPDGTNELHKVDLREVSLVLNPANPRARVLAVKSAEPKSLRETFRDAALAFLTTDVDERTAFKSLARFEAKNPRK